MKKKRYTEEQIIGVIKPHESGQSGWFVSSTVGISNGTFYDWRSKYAGMEVSEVQCSKVLESKNRKLKKWLTEELSENDVMQGAFPKKWWRLAARNKPSFAWSIRLT